MATALFVLYDGFTEYEYQLAALALHHYGVSFDVVGLDSTSVVGMMDMQLTLDRMLAEATDKVCDALVLPGMATAVRTTAGEYRPVDQKAVLGNKALHQVVRHFLDEGRVVAAICFAVSIPGSAGVLVGRKYVYAGPDTDLFAGAVRVEEAANRDGNVITGLGSRPCQFNALLVDALAGPEAAADYRKFAGI